MAIVDIEHQQPQYLSVQETASRLGIHENTVRNWVKHGILRSARIAGSRFHRFEATEVERVARSRGAAIAPIQETRRTVGPELIDGTQLHAWADRLDARGVFPKLVRRLLAATPGVEDLAMRAGEGIASPGWDGLVHAESARTPVPAGPSAWELGVGSDPRAKAQADYDKRTADPLGVDPALTTFVFVTPRRWSGAGQWETERRADAVWRDVRVIDADSLETWLEATPGVHYWISEQLGFRPQDAQTVERWWQRFSDRTQPAVPTDLVLAGRADASDKLREFLTGDPGALGVSAAWRDEALAFVAASLGAGVGDEGRAAAKPVVVISAREVWDRLVDSRALMVLVPVFDSPDLGAALARGHHAVIPIGQEDISQGAVIKLPRVARDEARKALGDAGVNDFRHADELAALARRSMASLVRALARDPRLARPAWGQRPASDTIAPLMLVGSWSPIDADHQAVAEIVGRPWADIEREIVAWLGTEDPPFTRSGGQWHLTSPEEGFAVLECALLAGDYERWSTVVLRVLGETDPTLDLSPEERALAPLRPGATRTYSGALRRGLAESLALLGALGQSASGAGIIAADQAARVVRQLLERANADETGLLWRSLSMELPRLAEAAPQVFLDAVESGLSGESPLLATMFRDSEHNSLFNTSSPHTGLLWALEVLCWSPDYLLPAVNLLGGLAEIDPGGRLANRPSASLRAALLPWLPYTAAPLDRRLEAVRQVRERYPAIGWKLLLSLLPRSHDSSSPTSSPRFRYWKPDREGVLVSEWAANVAGLLDQAVDGAGDDPRRWADLVAALGSLSPDHRDRLLDEIDQLAKSELPDREGNLVLWERLTNEAARHRSFSDAEWSMDDASLRHIETLSAQLEPTDAVERHARLFDWRPDLPGFDPFDHETGERVLREARTEAIRDTLATAGPEGLLTLAEKSVRKDQVGWTAAEVCGGELADVAVPWLETEGVARAVAAGWVRRMALLDESWTAAQAERIMALSGDGQASFLLGLPAGRAVWPLLEQAAETARDTYWKFAEPWGFMPDDVEFATEQFIAHNRPWAAIDLVAAYTRKEGEKPPGISPDLVEKALRAGLSAESLSGARASSLGYEIGVLLDYLEAHDFDDGALVGLEFACFPAIEHDRAPRALFAALARDPGLFVDLVSRVYRGKSQRKRQLDEQEIQLARNAWSILNSWRRPPGADDDGNLDGAQLRTWVRQARLMLADRDRADIGDEQIGQLLSGSPLGNDDAWPAKPIRDLIEEIGSRDLESGVHVGVMNARGVTSRGPYDGGQQEWELAAKYRHWASATARWHRTSRLLRNLAEDYEREARREDAEAERDADT